MPDTVLTPKEQPSSKEQPPLKSFLIELGVYAVLVVAYFLFVLHFLGEGIKRIYDDDKRVYAVVALVLMVTQGYGLERLTTWLLKFVRSKTE